MPRMNGIAGPVPRVPGRVRARASFPFFVRVASGNGNVLATQTAFFRATWTTMVASIIPAATGANRLSNASFRFFALGFSQRWHDLVDRRIFDLNAQFFRDELAAGKVRDILQRRLAPVCSRT
jgi:hypothetical protein